MPSLDVVALKKELAAGKLGPLHVFLGEDLKLIDRMVDAVEATIDEADRAFAVDRLYAGEAGGSAVEVVAAARSLPMLGDRRIVIVLRAERWLKPKRAGGAAAEMEGADESGAGASDATDLGALEAYVTDPSSFSTVLFVTTELDRSRRITKRLIERAAITEFSGLAGSGGGRQDGAFAAAEWVKEELARSGRTIEPAAARLLADRAGGDIGKLRGDTERLLLYAEGRAVTAEDVREVVTDGTGVDDDWAVVNAIANGDPARVLAEVAGRLDRGDSPHALLGQLRWWVSSRLAEADAGRVKPALDAILRTDLALKSSGGDERVLLERLALELTGRPLAQRGWSPRR